MTPAQTNPQAALEKLLQSDPDQLFTELGLRHEAIKLDPSQAGLYQTTATYDAAMMGPLDFLKEWGQNFFDRFSKDVYGLVCGIDKENSDERKKLLQAFGLGDAAFGAALTAVLMSWFGWAPAIAAVVAALVVKLFFKNAYASMCEVWKKRLPA
jgi:hypothetical protein